MSESPAPRPSWQFSGRRGTPVHKRSEATAALPPEIRQVVDQLVRERVTTTEPTPVATPNPQQGDASITPTSHGLRKPAAAPTSPVSASPRPVERRGTAAPDATTQPTIIPPAEAAVTPLASKPEVTTPEPAPTPVAAARPDVFDTIPAEATAAQLDAMPAIDADDDADEPGLLQRTRRLIGMPLRRPRAEAPAPEDTPAPATPAAPTAAVETSIADTPPPAIDEPTVAAPEVDAPATLPDTPAADAPAPAAPTDEAPETTPASSTLHAPDASAGLDAARTAGGLIGQPPIAAELAPTPAPASAGPRSSDASVEPSQPSQSDASTDTVASEPEPQPEPEPEPEPAATPAEPAATKHTTPAAKPARPRSGKRGGKRRRGSLAWESARPRTPIESGRAAQTVPAAPATSTMPDEITRLDAPLHAPLERTNDEPRFTRQRAVARRSELDVALSDLSAFVDTTTSRRS